MAPPVIAPLERANSHSRKMVATTAIVKGNAMGWRFSFIWMPILW
jgi:hypothetical protein